MNPSRSRASIIYLLLIVGIIVMFVFNFQQQASTQSEIPINEVADDIRSGMVARIVEDDDRLNVIYNSGEERVSYKEPTSSFVE